jgi:hypothetical protein
MSNLIMYLDNKVKKIMSNQSEIVNKITNIWESLPIINLFTNPDLDIGFRKQVKGIAVGYSAAIDYILINVEEDNNLSYWQKSDRRLRISVKANGSSTGVNCCGNWYCALLATGISTNIRINTELTPITYFFEYKVIKRTSSKGYIKIGWEKGSVLDTTVTGETSEWKKAILHYTDPFQRGYFISFYPGEPNAEIEILLRNIVIAPGKVMDKFSNLTIRGGSS